MELITHPSGQYRFLRGIAPYSAGVAATPGHEIVWVTLLEPRPYREALALAADRAERDGGTPGSLCAVSLRSPAPMSLDDFEAFNEEYRSVLRESGVLIADPNPVARTNVVPEVGAVERPSLIGFGYSRPTDTQRTTFVAAGAAELRNQELSVDAIVRPGDTATDALLEKAETVLDEIGSRLGALGVDWTAVTTANVYTLRDIAAVMPLILQRLGTSAVHGIRWQHSRPPVAGLEFEMDARGVATQLVAI